jgi:hypothetical protein
MTEHPAFAANLARLMDHRELDVVELADRAGSTAERLAAVLAGAAPSEQLLRGLGPALGHHCVDLFVLAGLAVPEDLAPLDGGAGQDAAHLVLDGVHLPAEGRRELLELARALPQEERPRAYVADLPSPLTASPGGLVVRMLRYRNLNWMGMARILAILTPSYLSAATYGLIGSDRTELTPRLVTDFAAPLGIAAGELAALTGVVLDGPPPPLAPEAVDAAALLWEARRLSAVQTRHLAELARSMRGEPRNGYLLDLPGRAD